MTSESHRTASDIRPTTRFGGGKLKVGVRVTQVLLALFFVAAAMPKLLGDPTAVATFRLFGLGEWFRYFVAVVEIGGAIGLLIRRLSGLASVGLVGLMVGATVANLFVLPGAASAAGMTVPLGVLFGLIAWYRWADTRVLIRVFRRIGAML